VDDLPNGEATFYNNPDQDDYLPSNGHLDIGRYDWVQYKGGVLKGLKHGPGEL